MKISTRSQIQLHKPAEANHKIFEGTDRTDAFWLSLPIEWSSNRHAVIMGGYSVASKREHAKPNAVGAEKQDAAKITTQTSILIVEDNPSNQKVLKMQLSHLGYTADVVSSGQAAIDTLTTAGHHYKLVLMDVQMPGMDGLTATQKIREWEHNQTGHVRIVAVTAGAMSDDRDNCIKAGMDDFLSKPLRLDTLRNILSFLREE